MHRFIRKSLILAAAALPLSLSLGTAHASAHAPNALVFADEQDAPPAPANQDVPPEQSAAQKPAPQPATPQQPAKAQKPVPAGGYTIEQLGDVLRNMGYEPKATQNTDGNTFYNVIFQRGTWTFSMTLVLSNDKTMIWLSSPLTDIPDVSQASPQGLLKLMERNYGIGPSFFSYRPTANNRIYLSKPFVNRDMTPATFRAELEDYLTTIQDTYPLWDKKALIVNNTNATPQKQASADTR